MVKEIATINDFNETLFYIFLFFENFNIEDMIRLNSL